MRRSRSTTGSATELSIDYSRPYTASEEGAEIRPGPRFDFGHPDAQCARQSVGLGLSLPACHPLSERQADSPSSALLVLAHRQTKASPPSTPSFFLFHHRTLSFRIHPPKHTSQCPRLTSVSTGKYHHLPLLTSPCYWLAALLVAISSWLDGDHDVARSPSSHCPKLQWLHCIAGILMSLHASRDRSGSSSSCSPFSWCWE